MLSKRSSFKNQTCLVTKKSDAPPKPSEIAATPPPLATRPQPTRFTQRTNSVGHHEYDHGLKPLPQADSAIYIQRTNTAGRLEIDHGSLQPLSRTQSANYIQRTNSVRHPEYDHNSLQPLARTQSTNYTQSIQPLPHTQSANYTQSVQPLPRAQSTNFTQRIAGVGHHEYDHGLAQPTKYVQRTNSVGNQDYGHGLKPTPQTQLTKHTQRTNSLGNYEYDHGMKPLPRAQTTKPIQRTNSVGHQDYGHGKPSFAESKANQIAQRTNSLGHQEYDKQKPLPLAKKPGPIIEYPVSPDLDPLVLGRGVTNANHPQHRMVQINSPLPFTCMGCKEYGAGTRLTCQQCNYELHDFCALAPQVLKAHPLHSQHQLLFSRKPGKGILRSKCDVCGKPAKGYMFHCNACSFQLHPCCARLSAKMSFPTHPHPLVILPASANSLLSGDPGDFPCAECKRKRSGQVYRCTVCDYYLHAVCAKNMVNGLHANGIKGLDKPSRLGVAAKIASHVAVGFIGGLIEGLGEGLGEALTQNIVKGRCDSPKRSSTPGKANS